jgi:putative peptide zinc metalloprotease protein
MGRRVPRAGLKLVLVFPYAFVDTSEAWLVPRWRRMAIAAAGPASDLVLGGLFSLLAVAARNRTADAAFQLAIGAYLGALSNLNPVMDRDGAQLLADHLRQPGLRRRSRAYVMARLAGRTPPPGDTHMLLLNGIAGVAWSICAVGFVVVFSLRYVGALERVASPVVVWAVLVVVWLAVAAPVAYSILAPLAARRAHAEPAHGRA